MGEDLTTEAPEEVPETNIPAVGETKPTGVSVIKRGVPKNTKPAPAVVAIKMADLLGEGTAEEETDEVSQSEPDNLPTPDTKIEKEMQIKEKKELEKQKLQEAKTLEKERKLKEKQAKELEAKQKKQQEQLDKQLEQELLRLEKERKAQEKKLQEKLKKQQEKEATEEEKRQQKESLKAEKAVPSSNDVMNAP